MTCAIVPILSVTLPFYLGMPAIADAEDTVVYARDYGLVGDGISDDGPALQDAVQAVLDAPKPARLVFESEAIYYLRTGPDMAAYLEGLEADAHHAIHRAQRDTYMIRIEGQQDITIDGKGATFLLDVTEGAMGFVDMRNSTNSILRDFSIDYRPLPFADGLVIGKDVAAGYLDIKVFDEFEMPPLGGPSGMRDEQAYFGMVWLEGPHILHGYHYWLADLTEAYPNSLDDRIVRAVYRSPRRGRGEGMDGPLAAIEPNAAVFSIPVRGVAHRGGREVFRIVGNENATVEQVNVWSAPWFVFDITDNHGDVVLREVHIRPKPDTQRHTSAWRDAIHVTANHARLLFEGCRLEGMNDDAFNIKTLHSRVMQVTEPNVVEVEQVFPLSIVPWRSGDLFEAYSVAEGRLLGKRKITEVSGTAETNWEQGHPRSPRLTLGLEKPIIGLAEGDRVWNASSANTNTIILDSVIRMSSRLQSPLTIENCDITALAWFHGGDVEGPIPSNLVVKDSILRLGRGNPFRTVIFNSALVPEPPSEPVISNVLLQNNIIDGEMAIEHSANVAVENNRFLDTGRSRLFIRNAQQVLLRDNLFGDDPLESAQITYGDVATEAETVIQTTSPGEPKNLMKPFAHWYVRDHQGRRIRIARFPEAHQPTYAGSIDAEGTDLDAYRVPLAPITHEHAALHLEESVSEDYDSLEFVTWLPETAAVDCVISLETDNGVERVYEVRLSQGPPQPHRVPLQSSDMEASDRKLHIQLSPDGVQEKAWMYLGNLQLLEHHGLTTRNGAQTN